LNRKGAKHVGPTIFIAALCVFAVLNSATKLKNLKIAETPHLLQFPAMKPHFTKAIVRTPCAALINGITTADLGLPDYAVALQQHAAYVKALENCGLEVLILPADEGFPDSTFVEDVALCTRTCAVVTNPGAPSRNGERALIGEALRQFYPQLEEILTLGTLDAGDVMMVGGHFYIGLSERTNTEGAAQLIAILERHGMSGQAVPLQFVLHLKTGISYLENNQLLVCGEFVDDPTFAKFDRIVVETDESYAANCLWINDTVLVPAGFPKALAKIEALGYATIVLEMSEFEKVDGGLSCLSLRF
jgi:dimethylargininase